jgi:ABC-type transport system substrate-binding protein
VLPRWSIAVVGTLLIALAGCDRITNSPHPAGAEATNTFFTAFQERSPKYLDPTASYSIDETPYTYSIYEPVYRFHYLTRPYEVVPRAAERVVEPRYYDKAGRELPADAPGDQVAEAVYDIPLRKGIRFAPHPAFARDANGQYLYHDLTAAQTADKRTPFDFPQTGTRELTAHDYVYAFRRLATTRIKSPSFSSTATRSPRSTRNCARRSIRPAATCPSSTSARSTSRACRRSTTTRCACA